MSEAEPDERGIDLAIMAYIGAILAGEDQNKAKASAETMLEMFGYKRTTNNGRY